MINCFVKNHVEFFALFNLPTIFIDLGHVYYKWWRGYYTLAKNNTTFTGGKTHSFVCCCCYFLLTKVTVKYGAMYQLLQKYIKHRVKRRSYTFHTFQQTLALFTCVLPLFIFVYLCSNAASLFKFCVCLIANTYFPLYLCFVFQQQQIYCLSLCLWLQNCKHIKIYLQ